MCHRFICEYVYCFGLIYRCLPSSKDFTKSSPVSFVVKFPIWNLYLELNWNSFQRILPSLPFRFTFLQTTTFEMVQFDSVVDCRTWVLLLRLRSTEVKCRVPIFHTEARNPKSKILVTFLLWDSLFRASLYLCDTEEYADTSVGWRASGPTSGWTWHTSSRYFQRKYFFYFVFYLQKYPVNCSCFCIFCMFGVLLYPVFFSEVVTYFIWSKNWEYCSSVGNWRRPC